MTAFIAWTWQGIALAAVIELLLRGTPRVNAATRHAIWWGALLGLVGLGVLHVAPAMFPATDRMVLRPAELAATAPPVLALPAAPAWLTWCLLFAWAGGTFHGLALVVRGLRRIAALRRAAVPIDERFAAALPRWSRARSRGRPAQLLATDEGLGACALGFRRPAILVSRQLLATLEVEVLDQVVMHEQAHLDRRDDWLRLVQALITSLAAAHPAVHFIARRLDLEREAACDDRVVALTGSAADYATCLVDAAGIVTAAPPAAVPAVFVASSVGSLRARVLRVLDPRRDRGRKLAAGATLVAGAWLSAVLAFAPRVPFLVVFVHGTALQPREVMAARGRGADEVAMASGAVRPTAPPAAAVSRTASPARRVSRAAATPEGVPAAAASDARPESTAATEMARADQLDSPELSVVPEVLGTSGSFVQDAPPASRPVTPAPSLQVRLDSSFFDEVASFGRTTASTTWKAGMSTAGTFARAGKAVGRFF